MSQSPHSSDFLLGGKGAGGREICNLNKYSAVTICCLDYVFSRNSQDYFDSSNYIKRRQAISNFYVTQKATFF